MASKIAVTTRSNQVADYFESLIRQRIYSPGDKLPTLQEMANVLHMSKSTIREGLAALVAQRLIEVKHGSGYFVRLEESTEDELEEHSDLGHVLFVRLLLEVPAAKMAACNRDLDHLAAMARHLDQMRTGPLDQAIAADLAFHLVIAEASGNPILDNVIRSLSAKTRATLKYSRALAGAEGDLYRKHLDLFEAIRDRDGIKAERLMYDHLHDTAERLKILVPGAKG